jgi:hypothetical protein
MSNQLTPRESAVRQAGIIGLLAIAITHVWDLPHKIYDGAAIGVMFIGASAAALLLALLLLDGRREVVRLAWAGSGLLAATMIVGYVYSRLLPFPTQQHHIGDWADLVGIGSLVAEACVVGLAAHQWERHGARAVEPRRIRSVRRGGAVALVCAGSLAAAIPGVAMAAESVAPAKADEPAPWSGKRLRPDLLGPASLLIFLSSAGWAVASGRSLRRRTTPVATS